MFKDCSAVNSHLNALQVIQVCVVAAPTSFNSKYLFIQDPRQIKTLNVPSAHRLYDLTIDSTTNLTYTCGTCAKSHYCVNGLEFGRV